MSADNELIRRGDVLKVTDKLYDPFDGSGSRRWNAALSNCGIRVKAIPAVTAQPDLRDEVIAELVEALEHSDAIWESQGFDPLSARRARITYAIAHTSAQQDRTIAELREALTQSVGAQSKLLE